MSDHAFLPAPRLARPLLAPPGPAPEQAPGGDGVASMIGRSTRRVRGQLARLPGLTATADLLAARHCVDLLAAAVKEHPYDPLRYVWLAEALQRTQHDMRMLVRVRAATAVATGVGLAALIARPVVRGMAGLGEARGEEPAVRLLRRAFALVVKRVRGGDINPDDLHTLARVYLAQGMPAETLRLTRLATAMSPTPSGDVLVTAARAFHRLRRPTDAARMAERAIEHGSTIGYDVLAQLRLADRAQLVRRLADGVGDWRALRSQVRSEDRVRYFGATRTPRQTTVALTSAQWTKASATVSDAVALAGRTRKEPTA
jgi:hypothetical protein